MPAARRYKQSLVDELKEAIRALPPCEPPEPEHSTQQALQQLKEELRQKIVNEHVDVAVIVDLLNARGFKVKARDVRSVAQPKRRQKSSGAKAAGGGKGAKKNQGTDVPMQTARSGSFIVRPDEDDI